MADQAMEDYRDAHERHWEDAGYLYEGGRLGNADHLYGLSAECALKAILARTKFSGLQLPREYRIHIDKLWEQFRSLAQDRALARYAAALAEENPFGNWHVSHRYCNRSIFTPRILENHRSGAESARQVLHQAVVDGLFQ